MGMKSKIGVYFFFVVGWLSMKSILGNTVTISAGNIGNVGASLELTCKLNYTTGSLSLLLWYLDGNSGMQRDPADCTKITTPSGYDEARYSFTCDLSNFTFNLTIFNLTLNDSGCWNCSFLFTDTSPTGQASACITVKSTTPQPPAANSTSSTTTLTSAECQLELGLGLDLSLGIPCVITCIIVAIFLVYKGYTYAYRLGLLLGLGLGITFQVSWIIIASLISKGNTCKLELGLGLGLGSGIPCVITFSVAVIFMYKGGKSVQQLCDFPNCQTCGYHYEIWNKLHSNSETGNPSRADIGNGIRDGLFIASVIGIIVVFLIYKILEARPRKPTNKTPEEEPTVPIGGKSVQQLCDFPNCQTCGYLSELRNKLHSKSETDMTNIIENKGSTAVHTGTENKVKPKTASKQINDIHQPLPPLETGVEDTPKFRPQPQPPQNSDIKDHIQEASAEPKKKRKKKKKKGQMNDWNPEEEMVQLESTRALPGDQSDGD